MQDRIETTADGSATDLWEGLPPGQIDDELFVLALFLLSRSPEFNAAAVDATTANVMDGGLVNAGKSPGEAGH